MATTVTLKPNAIDLSGSTSGTTTLQATAVAGTTTITLPAATDTLVGKATTDTLTNKTLTSPTITGGALNGTLGATTPSTVAATTISASSTATFAAGAVGTPSITTSGDTNTGIFFPAADTIAFSEGGAESMRIDSSGNVGIGTTSPTASSSNKTFTINSPATFTSLIDLKTNETLNLRVFSGVSNSGLSLKTATPLVFDTNDIERMRIDSSGNLLFNSGYGSVATAYGCRAWVNFNGTGTVAIRGSGNVSSITDNGTGDYTVNFTTAMPDANYSVAVCADNTNASVIRLNNSGAVPTTGAVRMSSTTTAFAAADILFGNVSIFR